MRTLILCFIAFGLMTPMTRTLANEILFQAAAGNDVVILSELIQDGIDLEIRDDRGRTALLIATRNSAIAAAVLLMQVGADVNAKDDIEDSPYLYAGAEGPREILQLALAHGADLKAVNRYGGTALIPAAHHGHVNIVRDLVETDIDINHVNYLGWTALLETVILGDGSARYVEITKILLCGNARIEIADADGLTPLDHAQQLGQEDVVQLLEARRDNQTSGC